MKFLTPKEPRTMKTQMTGLSECCDAELLRDETDTPYCPKCGLEYGDNDAAAHSPLPWLSHEGRIWHWNGKPIPVAATDKRDASFLEVANNGKANAEFIVRACNNAQHLADALTTLFRECAMVHKYWGENFNRAQADAAVTKACEALAEWSKAQ